MGRQFADGVYQAELNYLIQHEFVQHVEDALWRRTKLGLYLTEEQADAISQYIEQQRVKVHALPLSEAS